MGGEISKDYLSYSSSPVNSNFLARLVSTSWDCEMVLAYVVRHPSYGGVRHPSYVNSDFSYTVWRIITKFTKTCLLGFPRYPFFFFLIFTFLAQFFRHFRTLPCKVNGRVFSLLLLEFWSDFNETWHKQPMPWANIGLCFISRFIDFCAFRGTLKFNIGVYGAKSYKSLLLWDLWLDFDKTSQKCTLPWSDTDLCFFCRFMKFQICDEFS